jgi:hypothetical protein
MREKNNANGILLWKPDGKGPLGRPIRTWVDNIEMDLRDRERMGWYDLIDLAEDRAQWSVFVNRVMNFPVP